jgi:XTP/dITP diphosphohydrolase
MPSGREAVVRGELEGRLAFEPRGTGGFGYDPIFVVEGGRTTAELTMEEKNAISHRRRALEKAMAILPALLGD